MTAETLWLIRQILQTREKPGEGMQPNDGEETTSGIGLLNVHQRLQLTFGDEYGLRLWNPCLGRHDI